MSSFSEQRRQLMAALVGAGISPQSAAKIAAILGNSAQEMRHSGAITHDTTPPDLRFVDSSARKLRFPNLDFRDSDPDYRPQRTASSEEKEEKQPEPNIVPVLAPQQINANFRVQSGSLTDVAGNGAAAQVNVRNVVHARPPDGLPLAMLDQPGNQLVGKMPRAQVGHNDGTARLEVKETGREVLWNLQMLNRSDYNVVTKIEFVPGKGIEVTYSKIKAWDENKQTVDLIPTVDEPVISSIVEDKHGLRGERRRLTSLASRGESHSFFNVYRVGRFTGGWQSGTSKEIEQIWPTSDTKPMVKNITRTVADTPSEKFVLFAVRTWDTVPPYPTYEGGPVHPDTKDDKPTVSYSSPTYDANGNLVRKFTEQPEYYAIEIEGARECNTFSYLDGLRIDQLTGHNPDSPSALSYSTPAETSNTTKCLRWRSEKVTVLTNASLTSSGLVFTTKSLYVLADAGEDDTITIPITDCPPGGGSP